MMEMRDEHSLQKKKDEIEEKEIRVFGILIDLIEPGSWCSGFPVSTTAGLTFYSTFLKFTGRRLPDASRPRKRIPLPELPQGRSDPKPSQLSQPPPSPSTALSKFLTLQSAIASSKVHGPRLTSLVVMQLSWSQRASQPFQRPNNP